MIKVSLNNQVISIAKDSNVEALLQNNALEKHKVAVAINGDFVPRSRYAQHILQDGDQIDVLTAVQGG